LGFNSLQPYLYLYGASSVCTTALSRSGNVSSCFYIFIDSVVALLLVPSGAADRLVCLAGCQADLLPL
jgi:hypothetical protein